MEIFPYIYEPKKSIEVYNQTVDFLNENSHVKEKIQTLGWIYHEVGLIIPQTTENFWSGHYFPYRESWDELQIATTNCFFGLYKQAYVSLRTSVELGMLSVYYNINDDGHNAVKNWYLSSDSFESNTPRTDKVWKILLSNNNIKAFNDKFDLRSRFDKLMFLHNYVHTKGIKFSNSLGILKSNVQTFEKEVLELWLQTYEEIVVIITTLHLLKYPLSVVHYDYRKKFGIHMPNFGGLEKDKIKRMASILPRNYMNEIETIASSDPQARQTLSEIISLPDLTEEQEDEQILDFYKFSIEHGEGFTELENNLYKLYAETFKVKMEEKTQQHIEILRRWAQENGFMESKAKRYGWKT